MNSGKYRFHMPSKLHFGTGLVGTINDYLKELSAEKVLIVTDQGLVATGMIEKIQHQITGNGRGAALFAEIKPNPTVGNVHKGAELVESEGIDTIVAVGGGSPIDAGKAISALSANKGSILDYELGKKEFTKQGPPLVVIPTTAGTGSEATMASVIMDEDANRKFDIVSRYMAPAVSLVDPESTYSLPPALTAYTGMDALTHAIEGYTATLAGPLTDAIHLKAITLIWNNLEKAVEQGEDRVSRENVMMGSMMAGIGFPNSGLGAVHGLCYALGCRYHLGHGHANALLLPHVMMFNIPAARDKMKDIGAALGLKKHDPEHLIEELLAYQRRIGIPTLSTLKVNREDFPAMAEESLGEYSNCNTNPRPVTTDDAVAIFEQTAAA